MKGSFENIGAAGARNKPDGGFFFFTVTQLAMAWTAFREGHIGLKELRIYFALAEMKSRRCECKDDQPSEFTIPELRRLVGGAGGEREALNKLKAVGLLRDYSRSTIEFATSPDELRFEPKTLEATLALIVNNRRLVPVPRRIIRLIAGGARRTLIATILGHLIRCMFYKGGMCHPKGCVKASWIAEVFGISERRVHEQRQHLVELGWLIPEETSQRTLNLYGLWVTINLAWNGLAEAKERLSEAAPEPAGAGQGTVELSPPPAANPAELSPPGETREPLPRDKNQEPASGGGEPAGICISESQKPEAAQPNIRDVKPEDLRDPARLLDLYGQAVDAGYISASEAARLNVFAAAQHARVIGSQNPPGLFVRIVRSGLWKVITQDDEDAARALLRQVLYPRPPVGEQRRGGQPGRILRQFSDDARFVRDITNVLRGKGVPESSVWRLVNHQRPEWTRERWEQALAELKGEAVRAGV